MYKKVTIDNAFDFTLDFISDLPDLVSNNERIQIEEEKIEENLQEMLNEGESIDF